MARPKKKNDTKSLNIKIDSKVFKLLDETSDKTGITKTSLVEKALKRYLENNKGVLKAVE